MPLVLDVYARLSDDREGTKRGIERQIEDGMAAVETYPGAVLGRVLKDPSKSAWRAGVVRPGWDDAVERLRTGQSNGCWFWAVDRFVRQPRDLEMLIDQAQAGALILSAGSEWDLSNPDHRYYLRGQVNAACKSSDETSRRIRRLHEQRAREGQRSGGGWRPFGYEPDGVTIRDAEAEVFREMAARALALEALRSIAADLQTRGVSTVKGGPWSGRVIRSMLLRPHHAGLLVFRGEVLGQASWPGIIDRATHLRLRALLTDPARAPERAGRIRRHLLTKIATCGRCGEPAGTKRRDRDNTLAYACLKDPAHPNACGGVSRSAAPVEGLVTGLVLARLSDDVALARHLRAGGAQDVEALVAAIDDAETGLRDLAVDFADRVISRAEWLAARARFTARAEDARRALSATAGAVPLDRFVGERGTQMWQGLSVEQKRAVLLAVVDRVVIHPTTRGSTVFDPSQIEVVWR